MQPTHDHERQEQIDHHHYHHDQQIDRHHDRFTTTDIKARSMFVSSMSKDHFHSERRTEAARHPCRLRFAQPAVLLRPVIDDQ
jgi:hypothetical protein